MQLHNYQFDNCFTVWNDEIRGILSPLYYISTPKDTQGLVPLKEVAVVNPTRTRPKLDADEKVAYVGLPETDDKRVQTVLYRPYKEVAGRNIIKKGDILFARIEPSIFNKKYIYVDSLDGSEFAYTSTEFYIVEAKDSTNPAYLFSILFSDNVYNQIIGKTTGSTGRRRLDKSAFENVLIPLPSRDIQDKIADIYLAAEEQKIAKKTKARKLLEEIDDYILEKLDTDIDVSDNQTTYTVFSDEVEGRIDAYYYKPTFRQLYKNLKQHEALPFSNIIQSITNGLDYRDFTEDGQTPYLRVSNIKPDGIDYETALRVGLDIDGVGKDIHGKSGDILLTRKGTFGVSAVIDADLTGIISSEIFLIRVNKEQVNPQYLSIYLNSRLGQLQFDSKKVGAIMGSLSQEAVGQVMIIIPTKEIQDEIVGEVNRRKTEAKALMDEIDASLFEAKAKIEEMILGA